MKIYLFYKKYEITHKILNNVGLKIEGIGPNIIGYR